ARTAAEADRARNTETTRRPGFGFTRMLVFMRATVTVPCDGASMDTWWERNKEFGEWLPSETLPDASRGNGMVASFTSSGSGSLSVDQHAK
ncbi:hypothetical protein, partial [Streptomyces sp. NPDC093149]|uniref:hypothetical protein n=1 Tax=Streptomyces sp. NPDC093149 TaxID=3366031 RepID=UPI0037F621BC